MLLHLMWRWCLHLQTWQSKKQGPYCHAVADKLLSECGRQENYGYQTGNLGNHLETVLECSSRYVSHATNSCILKDLI